MTTNRRKTSPIACLAFAFAVGLALAPSTEAGPISDRIARHRQNRQMRLPAMDKPFSTKPIQDLSVKTASLKDRFKKRFSLRKKAPEGVIPLNPNLGAQASP